MFLGVEFIESLVIILGACFQTRKGNPEFLVTVGIGIDDTFVVLQRQIMSVC